MSVGCGVSVVTRHLICVCLVSDEDLFALLRAIYLTMGRVLIKVESVLDCRVID